MNKQVIHWGRVPVSGPLTVCGLRPERDQMVLKLTKTVTCKNCRRIASKGPSYLSLFA